MDIFEEIADERRGLADLLGGLSPEQLAAQSLCSKWTVHDVAGHLIMPLEVGLPKFAFAMAKAGGNFDRANDQLSRQQAQKPIAEIINTLRAKAAKKFTPPGAGPEAPLTDVLVHGMDIRWPLDIQRRIPPHRLQTSLNYLTTPEGAKNLQKGLLDGIRLEATDDDWSAGDGEIVQGPADMLLLAITGRRVAIPTLDGDGVDTLKSRLLA